MDFSFTPTLSEQLSELVDAAVKARREAEPKRPYLGASAIGRDCERELAYAYANTPADPGAGFTGKLYRTFDKGHDGEARMAAYLRWAGFALVTHLEDGKQLGFSVAGGRMKGHVDGVLHGGPLALPYPCGWETKELNNKSWNDTVRKGVRVSKPVYFGQVQILAAYLHLPGFLFTAVNKDSSALYAEWVPAELQTAQALSDKGVRVISANHPRELARVAATADDWRCQYCHYRQTCWQEPH